MPKPSIFSKGPNTRASTVAVLATLATLAACAGLPSAQMRLPSGLIAAERLPVSGIAGGNRGAFSVGAFSGRFERGETRLALADALIEQRDATASFSFFGPRADDRIDATCRMHAGALNVGVVSVEAEPMVYSCRFEREGRMLPARFELRAAREGIGGMLSREGRRGEVELDGVELAIRSVHDLEGSRLQTAMPIGYLFEYRGEPVGAVSLNGAPIVSLHEASDARLRRSVIIAALALGLLRDPANSALDGESG